MCGVHRPNTSIVEATRLTLALAALWLAGLSGFAAPASPWSSAKGVVFPFYAPGSSEPVVTFKAERIFHDHERRGFFRIGLLPLTVGDGVTVELFQPAAASQHLARLKEWVNPGAAGVVELRRVQFKLPGEPIRELSAGRIRLGKDGAWQLLDGVVWRSGAKVWQAEEAKLHITGPQAGQLVLNAVGAPGPFNLFADFHPTSTQSPAINSE